MERVKDPEKFLADLERPFGGTAKTPTAREMDDEGAGFLAFASAFGIVPPSPSPGEQEGAV